MQNRSEHYFEDDDRNRLLEAIEQQAKSLSMARGSDQHRLSDWLNAAEEVMPEVKKPAVKQMSLASNTETQSNTTQIIGLILTGTLLLSIAIGGALVYMQLTQQINTLEKEAKLALARIGDLEKAQQESDKKLTNLNSVKHNDIGSDNNDSDKAYHSPSSVDSNTSTQQLESLLDSRFKQLIDAIDNRLQSNKSTPQNINYNNIAQPSGATIPTTNNPTISAPAISIPTQPQIAEVKLMPSSSDMNTSTDPQSAWLQSLPSDHLVLQLGSSTKANDLSQQGTKIRKNPEMAHVISVKANGSTRYILVYGGFATREEAKQSADEIKSALGITPWVRRAADVRLLLDKR
jgi:septal ring-binding cell division protein DamX